MPNNVLEHPYYKKFIDYLSIKKFKNESLLKDQTLYTVDPESRIESFQIGKHTSDNGQLSYDSLVKALELLSKNKVDGLCTAPISKTALKCAHIPFQGHTDCLKSLTQSETVRMAFHSKELNVVLATTHIPYLNVPNTLNEELISNTIDKAITLGHLLGCKKPRVAVAGLNPHAGERGVLGFEEMDIILPAIKKFSSKTATIYGPIPPDTVFWDARKKNMMLSLPYIMIKV